MWFISWKTCRRARGGRTLYLVSLVHLLLCMLHLGSFHPPAHRGVYMGTSEKDLRHSPPDSHHVCSSPLLAWGGDRTDRANRTGTDDAPGLCVRAWLCDCYYHDVPVCYCRNCPSHCRLHNTLLTPSSQRRCATVIMMIQLWSRKMDYTSSKIKQSITAFLFITKD